jgi:hypothetical protein
VLLGVSACLHTAEGAGLVTAEDLKVAALSRTQSQELCGGLEPLEIPENAKADLLAASGDNYALKAMRGSKDMTEFQEKLGSGIDGGFIVKRAGPLVSAFLFIVGYLLCCGTSCCCRCCRKCRVCDRRHDPKRIFKFIAFIVLAAILLGVFVAAVISRRGFQRGSDGFKATSCTGSKLLNTTLNGVPDPYYMGVLPSLTTLDDLVNTLNSDSTFIKDLNGVLSETAPIDQAVKLAAATLGLARDMVTLDANIHPKKAGVDLLHKCELCPILSAALDPAIAALENGVATQLQSARGEVQSQLTGSALTDLQSTVSSATAPLGEMKKMFVSSFGWMVESTTLQDFTAMLDSGGLAGTLVLVLLLLAIATVAFLALFFWTCREKNSDDKYRPTAHRLACCTWHCGCCYMFLALFIGGLMSIITIPLASTCMIMDSVSGQMLDDISGALSLNTTGDQFSILKDTIDLCFRNPDASANPNMLDIIFQTNVTSGEKVTLRKSIVTNTKDAINGKFDAITASMSKGGGELNKDANMVKLKKMFTDTSISGTMRVPAGYDFASSPYANMASQSKLQPFYFSSASCSDFTPPETTAAVPGLTKFTKTLGDYATFSVPGCAKTVTCKAGADAAACAAANDLMKVKQDLRGPKIMTCKTFKTTSGARCDVMNMVESLTGSNDYSNDCLQANGKLQVEDYACSIDEFTTLMQQFNTRLDKVLARLDATAASSTTKINVDMKGLVGKQVIARIESFADGANCGFLSKAYQGFIDSACYAGVLGFAEVSYSYVACGVLTFILIILMFIVWRLSIDNYNSMEQD